MVAGWFISCKTSRGCPPHYRNRQKVCIVLRQKNSLVVYGKNQQQQHNDLEIPLELSINKCSYQYPFFRNNHYYEDSPNLSYLVVGTTDSITTIGPWSITVNVGVIRMWRCKSN